MGVVHICGLNLVQNYYYISLYYHDRLSIPLHNHLNTRRSTWSLVEIYPCNGAFHKEVEKGTGIRPFVNLLGIFFRFIHINMNFCRLHNFSGSCLYMDNARRPLRDLVFANLFYAQLLLYVHVLDMCEHMIHDNLLDL